MITDESQLTGQACLELRKKKGLGQTAFWAPAHVSRGMGSWYEHGNPVSPKVQRLIFLHHVVGIPVDADKKQLKEMVKAWRKSIRESK